MNIRLRAGTPDDAEACGNSLMEDVLRRARERRFTGVRLVQAAYHNRSGRATIECRTRFVGDQRHTAYLSR